MRRMLVGLALFLGLAASALWWRQADVPSEAIVGFVPITATCVAAWRATWSAYLVAAAMLLVVGAGYALIGGVIFWPGAIALVLAAVASSYPTDRLPSA